VRLITPTRTANGLLRRPVPDRSCQRGVAVPGRLGPVDHLRRDADREFCTRRLLYARRLRGVHADRALFRRARLLGRHRRSRTGRGRGRRDRRDAAAAADLPFARAVPVARDLWPDADGRGPRGADLGPGRSARAPRAGIQGRGRLLRPEHPDLRPVPDRAWAGRARGPMAAVPAHALGHPRCRSRAMPCITQWTCASSSRCSWSW